MKKRSPLVTKILAILEHHGFKWPKGRPPEDLAIHRTHAGRHQRNCGAWSWCLWSDSERIPEIGSQDPANLIARLGPAGTEIGANHHGQWTIDPTLAAIRSGASKKTAQ